MLTDHTHLLIRPIFSMLKIYGYVPRSHASLDPVVKSLVGPLYMAHLITINYYDFQGVFNTVEQNNIGSYVVYRMPAIAAILSY